MMLSGVEKWQSKVYIKRKLKQYDGLTEEQRRKLIEELLDKPVSSRKWYLEDYINELDKPRWEKAFPMAGFEPGLIPPQNEEERHKHYKLAKQFCPLIYADRSLIEKEHRYLSKNLGKEKIREAIFNYGVGRFPTDLIAAKLHLISPILKGISGLPEPKRKNELSVPEEYKELINTELKNIEKDILKNHIEELFSSLFSCKEWGSKSHRVNVRTCVMKYRVVSDPRTNVYCIQYFAFWPIQMLPFHVFDYEPVYVYVHKMNGKKEGTFEPLLVTFNADPGPWWKSIRPLIRRKRPGHVIRTFINRGSKILLIRPNDFNMMADYMRKAYGGQYYYEPIIDGDTSGLEHISNEEGKLCFYVPRSWHAFDYCSKTIRDNNTPMPVELHPLKTRDLLHIDWAVRDPFKAPFLYPTVGEKNPMMHFPFDVTTFCDEDSHDQWRNYAAQHLPFDYFSRNVAHIHLYRGAWLLEFLLKLQGKKRSKDLWISVEEHEDSVNKYEAERGYEKIESLADCRKVIDINPGFGKAHHKYGSMLILHGEFDKALGAFERAISCADPFLPAHIDIAFVLLHMKEYEAALKAAEKAIKSNPSDEYAFYQRGVAYDRLRNLDMAFADFVKATKLNPLYASSHYACANVLVKQKELEKALEYIDVAIKLESGNALFYDLRGYIYFLKKEYKKALSDHSKAVELNPTYVWAISNQGDAFRKLKMDDEAEEAYNRAIELDSSHFDAFIGRGRLYMEWELWDDALKDLNRAVELGKSKPEDEAEAYSVRGELYLKTGKIADAKTDYKRLLNLDEDLAKELINKIAKYE